MSLWNRGLRAASWQREGFQSLFSWMSLWNCNICRERASMKTGFNPCFRGCRSGTRTALSGRPVLQRVSILVFVDVALELIVPDLGLQGSLCFNPCFRGCRSGTGRRRPGSSGPRGFQSLFSWMSLWNPFSSSRVPDSMPCFNPCFRGCRSGTIARRCRGNTLSEFQSLFSWMSLWNKVFGDDVVHILLFQSLFSWMSLWNE